MIGIPGLRVLNNPVFNTIRWVIGGDTAFQPFIARAFKEESNMARILKNTDGSGTLFVDGQEVRTYARARDAKRGANRLGYSVL